MPTWARGHSSPVINPMTTTMEVLMIIRGNRQITTETRGRMPKIQFHRCATGVFFFFFFFGKLWLIVIRLLENVFKIRPEGIVSKKRTGAFSMERSISSSRVRFDTLRRKKAQPSCHRSLGFQNKVTPSNYQPGIDISHIPFVVRGILKFDKSYVVRIITGWWIYHKETKW